MISKILVATDGSETASKAVTFAVELAKKIGATMVLMSVIDRGFFVTQSIPSAGSPVNLIEPVEDYLKQAAEAYLKEAEKLCKKKGIHFKKVIRTGHPVEKIVREAEKLKADLIVMGSQGKSVLKAAVLGSVAFGVIHKDTKIPVLIVRKK